MIVDLIISALHAIISALFLLLPDWDPLDIDTTAATDAIEGASTIGRGLLFFDQFFPIREGLVLLALLCTLWIAVHIYRLLVWFLTKVHVFGGSSD